MSAFFRYVKSLFKRLWYWILNIFGIPQALRGYSDAKPSESIQKHELPGLAVSVIFPYMPNKEILEIPVKQFKEYDRAKKIKPAQRLKEWLVVQEKSGLKLSGILHSHNQKAAAEFGLEFIEELPNTRVSPHYKTYRLFFEDEYIDFAQAIALEYYFFTINLGVLRAATRMAGRNKRLLVTMDRFPDSRPKNPHPGKPVQPTQGTKFLNFIQSHSETGKGISDENKSIGLDVNFGTLDWWKLKTEPDWNEGKTHPHFVLPDWFAAAAIANAHYNEYVDTFTNKKVGIKNADALKELYVTIKDLFDIWSIAGKETLSHIRASKKEWKVPDNARDFILKRASRP